MRIPWWGIPTRNTLDRATAMLPAAAVRTPRSDRHRRRDRLPDVRAHRDPPHRRRAAARALARVQHRTPPRRTRPYRDRILPVACIPTFTPEEAIAELEYAVGRARPAGRHDGWRDPPPVSGHRLRRAHDGSTASATRRCTTTRRCGRSASSSACRRRFTRPAPAGARAPHRPTTCSITSGTSRRRASSPRGRCSSAACRCASRSCASRSSKAARRGPAISSATCSATGRSATATRSGSTTRRRSTASSLDALFAQHAEGRVRERLDRLAEGLGMLSEPIVGDDAGRRVRGIAGRRPRRHRADLHRAVLLRVRGRRPDGGARVRPHAQPARRAAPRAVRERHRPLGRPRLRARRSARRGSSWSTAISTLDDFRAFTFGNPVALWSGTNPAFFAGTIVEDAVAATRRA